MVFDHKYYKPNRRCIFKFKCTAIGFNALKFSLIFLEGWENMREKKIVSKRTKALIVSLIILALTVLPAGTINISAADLEYNYAKALQYSMYFYDANMCGTGVEENGQYNWRGNCHVYDEELPLDSVNTNMSDAFIRSNISILDPDGDGKVDVSGGFHDAGDHVKFGMPEAYSASTVVGDIMNSENSMKQLDRQSMQRQFYVILMIIS